MLYKFKSQAAADLIMLQPNGERVLQIIGKDHGSAGLSKGVILPEQMPAAIAELEAAIGREEDALKAAPAEAANDRQKPRQTDAVSLRQRARPFIDMLRRCEKANKEIVWGV